MDNGAISNRTVRYLPISGMKLLFLECFLNCNYLTLPVPITCFSYHDIYLTCHGFMGCFVLVADGRREQQRQKAIQQQHSNSNHDFGKTTFFSSFYKTVRNLHWVSLLLIITLSSRLSKRTKKTKRVERNKQKVLL